MVRDTDAVRSLLGRWRAAPTPPEWTRDAASAATAYAELRRRLGRRLVEEERTSEHGHAHWDAYRLAMEEPTLHVLLLDVLCGEPDQGMALAPVFAVIEEGDPVLVSAALGVLVPGSREQLMAEQRARDVDILRAAVAGDAGSAPPADTWTPWVQRRVCITATDLEVLDVLAARGMSRHVRAQAAQRARRLRRESSAGRKGPASDDGSGPGTT